ncbi:hypothetical protein [Dyadobacter fermentans]|nr:hypothetical protein [Dyadobacter fermentans]
MNPNSALILSGPVSALDKNQCFALNDAAYALEKQLIKTQVGRFSDRNIRLNFLSFLDGLDGGNTNNPIRHFGAGKSGEAELIAANAMYLALPECRLNGLQVYMDGHCQTF